MSMKEKDFDHPDRLKEDKQNLESALQHAKDVRRSIIQKMGSKEMESEPGKVVTGTPSQPSDKKDPLLDNADDYIKIDRVTCIIKRDLEQVKIKLLNHEFDIVTWSKSMKDQTRDLCSLAAGVCGIGAGFTYSTIFSATRGSIVFMSWAFIIFLVTFLAFTLTQIMLSWLASAPDKINYPKRLFELFSRPLLSLCIVIGSLFTIAGAILLLLSLYGIQYAPIASGASTAVSFTKYVRIAFWLTASFFASGCLFLFTLHLVLILHNLPGKENEGILAKMYFMKSADVGSKSKDAQTTA